MSTYEMHRLGEDRPHVLSIDCWCQPAVLSYGDEPVYDAAGTLLRLDMPADDEDEDDA